MKQNMQNQTKSELYTDNKKWKYSSNPNDILKSARNYFEKIYIKETTSKSTIAEFFSKISNRKKNLQWTILPLRRKHFSKDSNKMYEFSNKY